MGATIFAGGDPSKVDVSGYVKGDILAADATGTLTVLGIGSNTEVLTVDTTDPQDLDYLPGGGGGGGAFLGPWSAVTNYVAGDTVTVVESGLTGVSLGALAPNVNQLPYQLLTIPTSVGVTDSGDGASYTMGFKFSVSTAVRLRTVSFSKSLANTGVHIGQLYNGDTSTKLTEVTFTGETASGVQSMSLVYELQPGINYILAVVMPNGHYNNTNGAFTGAVTVGAATIQANGGCFVNGNSIPTTFTTTSYGVQGTWEAINTNWAMIGEVLMTTSLVSGIGGPLTLTVEQFSGGPLVDLDALPTVTITNLQNGVVIVGPTTSGVTHPATGTYIFTWTAPVSGGLYQIVWDGLISGNPRQGSEFLNVYSASAVTVGPCDDGWAVDTSCCPDWDTYSSDLQEAGKAYARLALWAATGRRFGLCTKVVRPCGRYCSGNDGLGTYGYYWNGEGFFVPYLFAGEWRNCWCGFGFGCLTCQPDCQVYLDGPVNSIVSVVQEDVLVDPNTYRVDNNTWLVRTKNVSTDDCWILRQDYNYNSGPNTMIVTYLRGLPVPVPLQRAGGELACEWVKACIGAPCRLPQRVTSISRQGVTVSLADVDQLLKDNLTGIPTVDNVIHAYNPYGLQSRMAVVSPDIPLGRQTTWP